MVQTSGRRSHSPIWQTGNYQFRSQGSQYTSSIWIQYLQKEGIQVSMDGKGRAMDNVWIERFWKSIKYDYIYLNPCDDGLTWLRAFKTTSSTTTRKSTILPKENPMTAMEKYHPKRQLETNIDY